MSNASCSIKYLSIFYIVSYREETFDAIFEKYIHYLYRHFGYNIIIIFDGYTDYKNNIKAAEQNRRNTKINPCSDVLLINL